jgi:hypothetical protein
MTPHLLKKKYWEDKARDLREENDNLCAVNDSLIRNRIPSAGIWEQDLNLNPKNKRILRYVLIVLFCFALFYAVFLLCGNIFILYEFFSQFYLYRFYLNRTDN